MYENNPPSLNPEFDRRTLLRGLGLGVSAAAVGGMIAGCVPETAAPKSGTPLAEDGVKEFNFTTWSMNEKASKDQLQKLIDTYSSINGTKISTPSFPYNEFVKQSILQLRGGQLTGALQMDIAWLTSVASLGKLADLSNLAKDAGYADYALDTGMFEGKQVGLPWTTGAIGMVGNTELLDKAGISEAPKTLSDFEETLRALKGLGGGVIPYAAMSKVANLKDIVPWMWAFGSPVIENEKITVGDDPSIDALTWYKKVYDEGLIGQDLDRFDARALFGQSKVGIYEDAPAARKFVSAGATDPDIGQKLTAFGRPLVPGGPSEPQALAWGQLICVIEDAPGSFAAANFSKHMTSDITTVIDYFQSAGYPPATTAALSHEAFTTDTFANEFATRITPTAKMDPLWKYSQSALIYEALAKEVQALLIGKSTPKEAANAAREAMQKLIS